MTTFMGVCGATCGAPCDPGGQVETFINVCGANRKMHILRGPRLPVGWWNGTVFTVSTARYKLTGDVSWRTFTTATVKVLRDFDACAIEVIVTTITGRVTVATSLDLIAVELVSNVGAGTLTLADLSASTSNIIRQTGSLPGEGGGAVSWGTIASGQAAAIFRTRHRKGPPCFWSNENINGLPQVSSRNHNILGGGGGFGFRYPADRAISFTGSVTIITVGGTLGVTLTYNKAACAISPTNGTLTCTVDWSTQLPPQRISCGVEEGEAVVNTDTAIWTPPCSTRKVYLRVAVTPRNRRASDIFINLAANYCAGSPVLCSASSYAVGWDRGIALYTVSIVDY